MDSGFSPLNLCGDRNNPGLPAGPPNNVMVMKPADSPARVMSMDRDDAVRWETTSQVRREHPRWVVIWSTLREEFQASGAATTTSR